MVTGVETAGLVLGSLPLLIEGLKSYQKGIKSFKRSVKYDSSVKKLIRGVTEQKIWLQDNIDKLMLAAGNASGINMAVGDDHWAEIYSGQSGKVVEDYLGDEKQVQFKELMEDFETTLLDIANALHTVQRSRKAKSSTVHLTLSDMKNLALVIDVEGKQVTKRIWYLVEEQNIVSSTKELHDLNSRMNRILRDNREIHELKAAQASKIIPDKRKAGAMAGLLRQMRMYSDKLFEAFDQAWALNCHSSHDVGLFLDVPSFSSSGRLTSNISSFNFRALLDDEPSNTHVSPSWYEICVTVLEGNNLQTVHSGSNFTPNSQIPAPPAITITSPGTSDPHQPIDQVKNLCIELNQAKIAQKSLDLVLRCGHPALCYNLSNCQQNKSSIPCDTITLEALLASQKRILPRQKVVLALKLAASALQLKSTQWLCGQWSNQAIYFPKQASKTRLNSTKIEVEQPLILYKFEGTGHGTVIEAQPRRMFLELGIVLMEIFNEESIEVFAKREHGVEHIHPLMREGTARDWFDNTSEQMTDQYAKVVETCLSFVLESRQSGAQPWDDENLWKWVCGKIIGPLNEECGTFRKV